MRKIPPYGWLGLAIMVISEAAMLLEIEPFWSWHTPIAWSGYILFIDGLVWARRGDSWLTSARAEFAFLAILSIPLWLVFEFYNRFIENWFYINLPASPFWRHFGYAWSFATIWPAIFESSELVATFRGSSRRVPAAGPGTSGPFQQHLPLSRAGVLSMLAGAAMLVSPLLWPSPYLAAPVWLGFILLLDPLNARLGGEALTRDTGRARRDRAINLVVAGFLCGLLWEFWNYWARTRWIYNVPILPEAKLFEMPLVGYLGFPAFAIECFTMYVSARLLLWRAPARSIAL